MTAHRPKQTGPLDESGLLEVLFSGTPAPRSGWRVGPHNRILRPPTDVYETEAHIVVQVEIAGVRLEDFSILLQERHLTVSGVRSDPASESERRAYHQLEIHFGEFRSEVDLPVPVDESRIEAEYNQGFLRVILPKVKPIHIDVK